MMNEVDVSIIVGSYPRCLQGYLLKMCLKIYVHLVHSSCRSVGFSSKRSSWLFLRQTPHRTIHTVVFITLHYLKDPSLDDDTNRFCARNNKKSGRLLIGLRLQNFKNNAMNTNY